MVWIKSLNIKEPMIFDLILATINMRKIIN